MDEAIMALLGHAEWTKEAELKACLRGMGFWFVDWRFKRAVRRLVLKGSVAYRKLR